MSFDDKELKEIMLIAKKAGDSIVSQYNSNTSFTLKEDSTPLTEADLKSHDIITKGLEKLTPNIPILSEESGYISLQERRKWENFWLIDPLDGTRGFIDKTDDFCICIAYMRYNEPIFGLVYEPLRDTYYIANNIIMAYKVKDDNWQPINAKKLGDTLSAVVGRYSTSKKPISQHLDSAFDGKPYTVSGVGSALKFCLIAEGKYDYYPALGLCSEWDTAAGGFILRAAGGFVVDMFDNPLKYNFKNDFLSPIFFASGDFKSFQT